LAVPILPTLSLSVTMNINMDESERMSPDLMGPGPHQGSLSPSHEEPRDLSIKRKMRPVPPPLDLSKRNLELDGMIPEFAAINTTSPRSPLTQKSLPLRKRAHSWSFQLDAQGLQLPAGAAQGVIRSTAELYFRPVMVQQEDIVVVTPPDHPFYVHGKGWCSVFPDRTSERYSFPCQQLQEGDVCLPPYHPETTQTPIPVVTPDLTDAMKRFDFNDEPLDGGAGAYSAPPSATFAPHTHRTIFLSPPASPSKKGRGGMGAMGGGPEGTGNRPRRPMNGFMLFAKHHRLKLIQQYPGKDNRAISVLLGAMWKSLPEEDRESFNAEARAQAEERKRIDPDCWKRKRSHSTS
ncbi:hypothetical protein Pmani_037337, partial [Petrolisthes manimaculis]